MCWHCEGRVKSFRHFFTLWMPGTFCSKMCRKAYTELYDKRNGTYHAEDLYDEPDEMIS
jgi:hypothetical protein